MSRIDTSNFPVRRLGGLDHMETHDEYLQRVLDWVEATVPSVKLSPEVMHMLERAERRIVRLETRSTNALRYLGLVPGADVPDAGPGRVLLDDDRNVVVTGLDVTIREIALAAVLSGRTGEVNVVVNNHVWGVVHVTGHAPSTQEGNANEQ